MLLRVLLTLYGFWRLFLRGHLFLGGLWFAGVLRRRRLEQVVVAARLLEQLPEVVLAVQDPVEGRVGGGRQEAAAVSALEAGLVVGLALQGHLQKDLELLGMCSFTSGKQRNKILGFLSFEVWLVR